MNWSAALRAVPLHIVTPATHFEKVLELLAENILHRVYVLDDTEHAIGIITLTDILRQLLPSVRTHACFVLDTLCVQKLQAPFFSSRWGCELIL